MYCLLENASHLMQPCDMRYVIFQIKDQLEECCSGFLGPEYWGDKFLKKLFP